MILVDTSVWVDHFRAANAELSDLLDRNQVLAHPCVIGEVALGGLKRRADILRHLNNLPAALVAAHGEVMTFIERHKLANSGVGYVDACLLASAALTSGAALWSRDKTLKNCAERCGLSTRL